MGLTVIILAKEDNLKLKKAVESVSFADEIIVVKEELPVKDFSEVRNRALESAKGEWVLFVDSDEEVGEQLKREIVEITDKGYKDYKNYNISGVYFKRRDRFLGKWLKYGETASVRLLRLARKEAGKWERSVHEVWKVGGKIGELKNPLLHYSHETIEEMVEKLDGYSEIEAKWRLGKLGRFGRFGILVEMILFPLGKFIHNYFFRLGFLDGMEGFIHAGMMSGHSFLVRGKVLENKQETESRKQ